MKQILFVVVFVPFFCFAQHFGTTVLPVKTMPVLPSKAPEILEYLQNSKQYSLLNPIQREWFYWTNYSRSNPKRFWDSVILPILSNYPKLQSSYTVSLKKDLYNTSALPLVKPNLTLVTTCQKFAGELTSVNAPPSHTSPSGATFADRMKASGIKNCAGENISSGPSDPVLMLVLLYIDQGVPGLGHRKTLLNPAFMEMGVGVARYPDNNSIIIIQDFACIQK